MAALRHNVTNGTVLFDPTFREVQLINYAFKIDSDEFDIKPQINDSLSCSVLHSG